MSLLGVCFSFRIHDPDLVKLNQVMSPGAVYGSLLTVVVPIRQGRGKAEGSCPRGIKAVSKFWFKSGLFANFVGSNSIEDSMSLDWNGFYIICVYRMFCTLTQKPKRIFLKVSDQLTPFDRHPEPLLEVVQSGLRLSVFPSAVAYKPGAFH